jgi:anti-sigma B factor antagonist
MSGTAFCDSTGLNVLVRAHKRALAEGGALRVVVAEPTLIRIFTVIGADQMFPVFATLDEAVSAPPGTLVGQGESGPSA